MEGDPRNPRVSLLKKYDIPIDHLTYEYVEKCSNKKELERIIRILRSGEEGSYPDLLKVTEDKLRSLAPDSRVLRVELPALTKEAFSKEEWNVVENELLSWEEEMKIMDKSLDFEKGRMDVIGNKNMPEVRKIVKPPPPKPVPKKIKEQTNTKNERIRSGDYAAWDKFDVDKELLKMDVQEEREREENEKKKREVKKQIKEKKIELEEVDKDSYSSMEQLVLANQAKDCGNECYKSGDLENALKYYDRSINLYATANAYNNRAMTYLKLQKYHNVVEDCNKVLDMEKNNVKALLRRATAYQNLSGDKNNNNKKNYDELALQDLYKIVVLEPNNKVAQTDLQKLKKKLNIDNVGKKFRMPIWEGYSDDIKPKKDSDKKSTWSYEDDNIPIEKLPITYYGPSTSTFQVEPGSLTHRALSGSNIPGQVLCKCNSNRTRQNPLCRRCGEAIFQKKPTTKVKPKAETKPKIETKSETETILRNQKNQSEKIVNQITTPKEVKTQEVDNPIRKLESVFDNKAKGDGVIITEIKDDEIESFINAEKDVSKANNKIGKEEVDNKLDINSSANVNKNDTVRLSANESKEVNLNSENNNLVESAKPNKSEPNIETSSSQSSVNHSSKKSKKKKRLKGQDKEKKECKEMKRNYLEPVKIVQGSKFLHPTSVEPKIKKESPKEPERPVGCQFKEFVPNRKCSSGDSGTGGFSGGIFPITPSTKTSKFIQNNDSSLGKIMNDLSLEGNKENISGNQKVGKVEEGDVKKEVVESAFEFVKTWEELKKVDENYAKRAEIIRAIKPSDLGKVIGIKLDSDMLSCLLECLEKHFVENEPKVVVEFLKQLPHIPRFGLVNMFLAEKDKNIMKKLIEVAEGKGFQLDEDTKKGLSVNS